MDTDTGARYVYLDGLLHPVLNYASARLVLGENLHVVSVATPSLDGATRGPMIGIPLAPDSLPDPAHIAGTDWSVCAVGRAVDGEVLRTEIRPGVRAAGSAVDDDSGYLVRTTNGQTYLVWSGHAHPVAQQWMPALGYSADDVIEIDDTFVTALPAGEPIAPPAVTGLGEPGPALPGSVQPTTVGSIFADRTNAYYLMTRDGLATLTPLQAQLLLADPALSAAYGGSSPAPLKLSQAQVTEAAPTPLPPPAATLAPAPPAAPGIADVPPGEQQLCARYTGGADPDLVVGPTEVPAGTPAGGIVALEPGTGALVAERQGTDSRGSTVFLVTDAGIRYPLAGQRALEQLGLAGAPIAQLPAEVLTVIPVGPTLDPAAAAAPAS
jgi:type VII secretion protein EccB